MRIQLIDNNKKMWNRIIEEKEFHASIAHDIRVPLMVLGVCRNYFRVLSRKQHIQRRGASGT